MHRKAVLVAALVVCASACAPSNVAQQITIGDNTHICVIFNGVARAYFTPLVDKFTRLQFNGSACPLPSPW